MGTIMGALGSGHYIMSIVFESRSGHYIMNTVFESQHSWYCDADTVSGTLYTSNPGHRA